MDRRDQDLLDRQLQWLIPAQRHGGLMAVIVAIFFLGVMLGTFFPHVSQ